MKKQTILISALLVLTLTLSACGKTAPMSDAANKEPLNGTTSMQSDKKEDMMAEYKKITAEEAQKMMSDDAVILDVRTTQEFEEAHIPNAILLSNTDIADKAEMVLTDKEQTILVYCRSGNRSASAARELIAMGYKNVYDFGGINDWMGEKVSGKSESMMAETKKEVDNPAPAFMFTDFDGNTVSLADFEGKKVYIKFWASWCSVCLKSLPETDELSTLDNDFEVITVVAPGFSGEKSMANFKKWYEGLGYKNITVLFDENGKYMKEFGVRAFPSSAYIGADGSLLDFSVGHMSNDKIRAVFDKATSIN